MLAIITLLVELSLLALNKSLGAIYIDDVVSVILILLFSVVFIITVQDNIILNSYSTQIICGYFFRILLLLFDIFGTNIISLPQSGSDSAMFFRTSVELVLYGKTNRPGNFNFMMSRLFQVIGISKLYGQFLLMLLSIVAIVLTINTIDRFNISTESKQYLSWIICLLPNFALLSSIFLRESTVTLLVTISACCMIRWMQEGEGVFFLIALVTSILSCIFHSGCIGITIGCIVCLMIYDRRLKQIHVTLGGLFLSVAIALMTSFIFIHYGETFMQHFLNVQNVGDIANNSQLGGSSYARYVGNSDSLINMVIFSIPRIIYFLFSPFPWQWRGVSDIIAFFFSGLYYLMAIKGAIDYLLKGDKSNKGLLIGMLAIAFFCTFIFAWGSSNTGTASRHREKMVCIYLIIMALSLKSTEEDKKQSVFFK